MKVILAAICFAVCFAVSIKAERPYVLVTGTAQDAGAPQLGCMTPFCIKAWKNKALRKMVSSLALVNPDTKQRWIFDATPDLPSQFQLIKEITRDYSNIIDGIFLTHAHIGHYTGLMYLGKESINAKSVKVYSMPRMKKMLENNAPWSQLVQIKNISLEPLQNGKGVYLSKNITVTPFLVPHRDEFSETVGFRIKTDAKSFVFIPDIDKWSKWKKRLEDVVKANDYIFVDGTFYQEGEIMRPMSEVPHPFVSETVSLLSKLSAADKKKVHFIHFNHSNPLIQGNKLKISEVVGQGFRIAIQGQIIEL